MIDEVTAAIEASVADLKDSGADTSPAEDTAVDTPTETAAAEPADTKTDEPNEEAELSALEKELVSKTPTLQKGRINVSRHQAVLTRARKQHEAALAEVQKKYDALKTYESPEVAARIKAFEIFERDPDRALQILQTIPDYKTRLDKLVEDAVSSRAPKETPKAPEEPKMVLRDDGTLGYDAEGIKALLAKERAELQKEYDARLAKYEETLKPFQDAKENHEQLMASVERQRPVLENARTNWKGFSEHESAIRAELSKPGNERIGLFEAYLNVVAYPQMKDPATMEAELTPKILKKISENSSATKSLRAGLPEAHVQAEAAADDTEAIIRDSIRGLKR